MLLDVKDLKVNYKKVEAVKGVSFSVEEGTLVSIIGANGAGKTTLMNVLFGAYQADAGAILIDGKPVRIRNSADALAHGIGMVHQHFHLAPRRSVLENLLIGQPGRFGMLDRRRAVVRLDEIRRDFGLWLDPTHMVSSLSIGEQQRLEIVKALFRGARLLILDEPTAVLTPTEAEGLFTAMRAMSEKSFGIVFITHKLAEARAVATRCVIMRHGKVTGAIERPAEASNREIARLMCGRDIAPPERAPVAVGDPVLELKRVSTHPHGGAGLADLSLTVRGGEIVGVAGVSGNGQRALADLLSGTLARSEGQSQAIGIVTTVVLASLGGCWWPIEITPPWMRQFSMLLPTGWAMDGLHKLLSYGAAPASILPHVAALLSLACLAGWISCRRFRFE